jgi:hypothetical protein
MYQDCSIHYLFATAMRLLLLTAFIFCCAITISAQGIIWITHCDNRSLCLNLNSCTQANVFIVPEAHEDCLNPGVTLSYKVDIGNNNSVDLQAMDDTLNTTFPKGTHKVSWRATDQCGHLSNCTYLVTVEDCQAPQLLCISQLSQQIDQPDCSLIFTAQQFITAMSDNCSPNNLIDVGMRKKNSGTGFPTTDTLSFATCDEGENLIEILVRDEAGFISQCNTKVIVQDGNNDCDCNQDAEVQIAGCVKSSTNKRMSTYKILGNIESTAGVTPPINITLAQSVSDSCFDKLLAANLPFNASYKANIKLERTDDPLNGVSTFDLVLISKHILAIESFTSFYQVLAADVNKSNSVTTFDIVELRKLILGIYQTNLPSVPSWRFIRPIANLSNLNNFAAVRDTYQITLPNLTSDLDWAGLNFIGIKHGDVNGSVTAFSDGSSDGSYLPPIGVKMTDEDWADAGDVLRIPITMNDTLTLNGWQLGLRIDPDLAIVEGIEGIPSENYTLENGALRALWYDAYEHQYNASSPLIYLTIKALQSGKISDMISLDTNVLASEVYTSEGVTRSLSAQPFKKVVLPAVGFHQSNQKVSTLR